jgi:hypothetical protein
MSAFPNTAHTQLSRILVFLSDKETCSPSRPVLVLLSKVLLKKNKAEKPLDPKPLIIAYILM